MLNAGQQGLVAGRLFVNGKLAIGASSQIPLECSGFSYESRFFVTTIHSQIQKRAKVSTHHADAGTEHCLCCRYARS